MSTTDIIPGIALTARCMTEVMEYIKKQDEEIKKLKKGNETYEDLLAGEKGLIDEINKLKEENKKLQEFCKRGRVAKKDSPLEEMFLREAGLMYHDDGETLVSSKKPQID